MNETIKLKPVYLIKSLIWLAAVGTIISVLLFLGLRMDLSYRYILSMILFFLGLLIVFYLNKDELEKISIEGEKLEFTFFNKAFFKRTACIYKRQQLEIQIKEKAIEVYKDKKIILRIYNSAACSEDLLKLKTYFSK